MTPAQEKAVPNILEGHNVLISSPTGSGKTLAAFLGIMDRLYRDLARDELEDKIYCIYISPLRALANDIERNLQKALDDLMEHGKVRGKGKIRLGIRTGDTPSHVKTRMISRPPHILITTPESLALALASTRFSQRLSGTEFVIVDEIHELTNSLRGSQLSLCLEWLEEMCTTPPARIGLSATQSPLKRSASFLGGNTDAGPRKVKIIDIPPRTDIKVNIVAPVENMLEATVEEIREGTCSHLKTMIMAHRTTIVFTNTRAASERIVERLKKMDVGPIAPHHGSMGREIRQEVETSLKQGELKAVVTSTSLELGIDIGSVDLVCLVGFPHSVSKALQRLGRSGHSLFRTSEGALIPQDPLELVNSIALARALTTGIPDAGRIPGEPLEVLSQVIVGMSLWQPMEPERLHSIVRRSYPFRKLSLRKLKAVVEVLSGDRLHDLLDEVRIFPRIWYDRETSLIHPRRGSRVIYNLNCGTIVDEERYRAITMNDGREIGTLNGSFVSRLSLHDVFVLGGRTYQVILIEGKRVMLQEVSGKRPNVPTWVGEVQHRSDRLSVIYSNFLHWSSSVIGKGGRLDEDIEREWGAPHSIAAPVQEFLVSQFTTSAIPFRGRLVIEGSEDPRGYYQIMIHTCMGARVNNTLARHMVLQLEDDRFGNVLFTADDDSIRLELGLRVPLEHILKALLQPLNRKALMASITGDEGMSISFMKYMVRALLTPRVYRGGMNRAPVKKKCDRLLGSLISSHTGPSVRPTDGTGRKSPRASHAGTLLGMARNMYLFKEFDLDGTSRFLKEMAMPGADTILRPDTGEPSPFSCFTLLRNSADLLMLEERSLLSRLLVENVRKALIGNTAPGRFDVTTAALHTLYARRRRSLGMDVPGKEAFRPGAGRVRYLEGSEEFLEGRIAWETDPDRIAERVNAGSSVSSPAVQGLLGFGTLFQRDLITHPTPRDTANTGALHQPCPINIATYLTLLLRTTGPMTREEIHGRIDRLSGSGEDTEGVIRLLLERDIIQKVHITRKFEPFMLYDDHCDISSGRVRAVNRAITEYVRAETSLCIRDESEFFDHYQLLRDPYSLRIRNIPLDESSIFDDATGNKEELVRTFLGGPGLARKSDIKELVERGLLFHSPPPSQRLIDMASAFKRKVFTTKDLMASEAGPLTLSKAKDLLMEGLGTGLFTAYPRKRTRTGLLNMDILGPLPAASVRSINCRVIPEQATVGGTSISLDELSHTYGKELSGGWNASADTEKTVSMLGKEAQTHMERSLFEWVKRWGPVSSGQLMPYLGMPPDLLTTLPDQGKGGANGGIVICQSTPDERMRPEHTWIFPRAAMKRYDRMRERLFGLPDTTRKNHPGEETDNEIPAFLKEMFSTPFLVLVNTDPLIASIPRDHHRASARQMQRKGTTGGSLTFLGSTVGHFNYEQHGDRTGIHGTVIDLSMIRATLADLGMFISGPVEELSRALGEALGQALLSFIEYQQNDLGYNLITMSEPRIFPADQHFLEGVRSTLSGPFIAFEDRTLYSSVRKVPTLNVSQEDILREILHTQGLDSGGKFSDPLETAEKLLWLVNDREVRTRSRGLSLPVGHGIARFRTLKQLERIGLLVRGPSSTGRRGYCTIRTLSLFSKALNRKMDRTMTRLLTLIGTGPISKDLLLIRSSMSRKRATSALKRLIGSGKVYLDGYGHLRRTPEYPKTPLSAFRVLVQRVIGSFGVLDLPLLSELLGRFFSDYELRWALQDLVKDESIRMFMNVEKKSLFYSSPASFERLSSLYYPGAFGTARMNHGYGEGAFVIDPSDRAYFILKDLSRKIFGKGRFMLLFKDSELVGGVEGSLQKDALIVTSMRGREPDGMRAMLEDHCALNGMRLFWSRERYERFKKLFKDLGRSQPDGYPEEFFLNSNEFYNMDLEYYSGADKEIEGFDISVYGVDIFSDR